MKTFKSEYTFPDKITFKGSKTSSLSEIEPRYGSVEGGTNIKFKGVFTETDLSKYKITIDKINCPVRSVSTSELVCVSGPRPGLHNSSLSIFVEG